MRERKREGERERGGRDDIEEGSRAEEKGQREGRREEAKESGLAKVREADRSQPRSELVKESLIYPKITAHIKLKRETICK